jgi:hypothetical protein
MKIYAGIFAILFFLSGAPLISGQVVDPDTTERAIIDRFSMQAGNLFVRDSLNMLPGPNEPIDFDQEPFITHGLGPEGEFVSYYNFDVQPTEPAPIYVLFREGETMPVEGQLNIIDVIPGDEGYNDFWRVHFVTVPQNYVANTVTSAAEISMMSFPVEQTDILVNCPVVPEGSTAELRLNSENPDLVWGWYRTMVVFYFTFSERELMVNSGGMVPVSPIYVTFNINPGEPGGGPPSGFMTDETGRTHNVVATLPEQAAYSPLWSVNIYDNADFENVHDLASALAANILVFNAANVNCPVVAAGPSTSVNNTGSSLPSEYSLNQNYPNPFNPSTIIRFSIINNEYVSLKIYNIVGQEIAVLVNEFLPAGNYEVNFDADDLTGGVYFYTISTGSFIQTKKMLLLR